MKLPKTYRFAKILHAVMRWDSVLLDCGPMSLLVLQDLVIRAHHGAEPWELVAYMRSWLCNSHREMGEAGDHEFREAQLYMIKLALDEMDDPLFEQYVAEKIADYNTKRAKEMK